MEASEIAGGLKSPGSLARVVVKTTYSHPPGAATPPGDATLALYGILAPAAFQPTATLFVCEPLTLHSNSIS